MSETFDVIVIGGGMAGIGIAAHLAPSARVLLLEAEGQTCTQSTGRSAAIFVRNYGNATLRALNAIAWPLMPREFLSPRGEMVVACEEELPEFESYLQGATGTERLTPDEAIRLFPALRPETLAAAAYERGAEDIDVHGLAQHWLRALRAAGGEVRTGVPVISLASSGGIWRVNDLLEAPVVVNAAGAWGDALARLAGVRPLGLQPRRRSAALLAMPAGIDPARWPMIVAASETWYAKPEAGRLMVSPCDEDPVEPHDAWADDMVIAEGLDRFASRVALPVSRPSHTWAGLRTFTPDRSPAVGFAPDAPGFFWLVGQGGYGIQTAPALSAIAAARILHRDPPCGAELSAALDPGRFLP